MRVHKHFFIVIAVLSSFFGFVQTATAQVSLAALDLSSITATPTWAGPFKNDHCMNCNGAVRVSFKMAGGRLVSVQVWGKMGEANYRDPYNPSLDLNDYGVLQANEITYKGEDMVLLYPGKIKITLRYTSGTLSGEMDPRENPKNLTWKVVNFVLRPIGSR